MVGPDFLEVGIKWLILVQLAYCRIDYSADMMEQVPVVWMDSLDFCVFQIKEAFMGETMEKILSRPENHKPFGGYGIIYAFGEFETSVQCGNG